MKSGRSLQALAEELIRQQHAKRDLVVPSSLMRHETDGNGTTALVVEERDAPQRYAVTELARRQLAEKLNIPFKYFEKMRIDEPGLLDNNVNTWLRKGNDNRMLRTLDGKVRAVLSDRYRRLDNFALAEHVMPILQEREGAFASVELTSTRMYLKFVLPRLKYEMAPGDVVQAGIMISNSEVGLGTLSVQPLVFRLVCSNGLIAQDHSLRKTHIGRSLGSDDEAIEVFRDDTLDADDRAFFLKAHDIVQAALSEVTFRRIATKMQKTMGIEITGNPLKTVEVLGQRFGLDEGERGGVLRRLITGGQLSGYGLVNAVTGFGQEVDDYDRSTELEAIGGRLIDLDGAAWRSLAEAA
ncbi:MAG: DUF932 domain-containing protein [Azoarcus sp.]|jgi:hypothetical protein|nr:DUF932 domain-containing protein [Azoarcus sp.]